MLCSSTNFRSVCCRLTFVHHTKLLAAIPVRHIPAWVPYMSYKPLAQIGYNLGREMLDGSLPFVKESIVSSQSGNESILLTANGNL